MVCLDFRARYPIYTVRRRKKTRYDDNQISMRTETGKKVCEAHRKIYKHTKRMLEKAENLLGYVIGIIFFSNISYDKQNFHARRIQN